MKSFLATFIDIWHFFLVTLKAMLFTVGLVWLFSNSCFACTDKNKLKWYLGEAEHGGFYIMAISTSCFLYSCVYFQYRLKLFECLRCLDSNQRPLKSQVVTVPQPLTIITLCQRLMTIVQYLPTMYLSGSDLTPSCLRWKLLPTSRNYSSSSSSK